MGCPLRTEQTWYASNRLQTEAAPISPTDVQDAQTQPTAFLTGLPHATSTKDVAFLKSVLPDAVASPPTPSKHPHKQIRAISAQTGPTSDPSGHHAKMAAFQARIIHTGWQQQSSRLLRDPYLMLSLPEYLLAMRSPRAGVLHWLEVSDSL